MRDTSSPKRAVARPVRTRHVRQVEEADCGASCLSVLLAWFGRHVPWGELQQVCGGGRDGVTAATLIRAAAHYGLAGSGKRIRLSGDDQADARTMRSLAAPAILFVGGNHFVVLDHVSERGPSASTIRRSATDSCRWPSSVPSSAASPSSSRPRRTSARPGCRTVCAATCCPGHARAVVCWPGR